MKKLLVWGSLLGLLVVGSALAQTAGTNTDARNGYFFSSTTGAKTDANGNAYTNEADKDRDYFLNQVVIDDTTACFMVDSMATSLYTAPYGRLGLWIRVTPAFASTNSATPNIRLAITVLASYTATSDSTNTVPWFMSPMAGATDSTSFGSGAVNNGLTVLAGYEIPVNIGYQPPQATKFADPFGAYIELVNRTGAYYWAPYTKIKLRVVSSTGAVSHRFTVRLFGRPF